MPERIFPSKGTKGVLIKDIEGKFLFRVYHNGGSFTDYRIAHYDLNVTIDDESAEFYELESGDYLDYSREVLGK